MSVTPWDCLSCGAHAQAKPFCETCGAAMPVEGEDSALSMMLGLVCDRCDTFNDPGVSVCASCAAPLGEPGAVGDGIDFDPATEPPLAPPAAPPPPPPPFARAPTPASIVVAAPVAPPPASQPATAPSMPSWMSAPTGQPLATAFAMPKVDLAAVAREGRGLAAPKPADTPMSPPLQPTSTPMATPVAAPMPPPHAPLAQAATVTKASACWRCGVDLETDDKFCRNCGARTEGAAVAPSVASPGGASPMATTQIAAAKMPGPLPSPMMPQGATMVMPAMRVAQQGVPGAAAGVGGGATMLFSAQPAERTARLILVRGHSQSGSQWRIAGNETVIGRAPLGADTAGAVLFPEDTAMAKHHCRLVFRGAELWLEPEETLNGVFLRVRDPVRLAPGDEMVVGAQRLRVLEDEARPIVVPTEAHDTTRVLGSLVRPSPPISLLRVGSVPALNEVYYRCQRLLTIGRNNCDLNFPRDTFVSERHAQITHEGTALVLEDLRSRNGTYVRARVPTRLAHGDLVLLGDKVLRVELPRG